MYREVLPEIVVGPTLVTAPFARPPVSGAESAEAKARHAIFIYQLWAISVSDFVGLGARTNMSSHVSSRSL